MKKIICLLASLLVQQLYAAAAPANKVQEVLDRYKDSVKDYGLVVLVQQGSKVYKGVIGNDYPGHAMSQDEKFSIASCSKMFTAAVVLKLAEEKKLSLDDSLKSFSFIAQAANKNIDTNITVRQLLSHTSGLKDVLSPVLLNRSLQQPYDDYSEEKILAMINGVDFAKGTQFNYSNINYFVLACIIEEVTDMPMEEALRHYIIGPYKLSNTLPYTSAVTEGVAHPVMVMGGAVKDMQEIPKTGMNKISRGVGNIVSNAEDLNRFLRLLLLDRKILSDASIKEMTAFDKYYTKFGLGVEPFKLDKNVFWGHTGRSLYRSFMMADPATGTSYILLCNNANDVYANRVFKDIVKAFAQP